MQLQLYATLLLQIREAREAIKELETDGLFFSLKKSPAKCAELSHPATYLSRVAA